MKHPTATRTLQPSPTATRTMRYFDTAMEKHYPGGTPLERVGLTREKVKQMLTQPRQHRLWREMGWIR